MNNPEQTNKDLAEIAELEKTVDLKFNLGDEINKDLLTIENPVSRRLVELRTRRDIQARESGVYQGIDEIQVEETTPE